MAFLDKDKIGKTVGIKLTEHTLGLFNRCAELFGYSAEENYTQTDIIEEALRVSQEKKTKEKTSQPEDLAKIAQLTNDLEEARKQLTLVSSQLEQAKEAYNQLSIDYLTVDNNRNQINDEFTNLASENERLKETVEHLQSIVNQGKPDNEITVCLSKFELYTLQQYAAQKRIIESINSVIKKEKVKTAPLEIGDCAGLLRCLFLYNSLDSAYILDRISSNQRNLIENAYKKMTDGK